MMRGKNEILAPSVTLFLFFCIILLVSRPVLVNAHRYQLGDIAITHPWAMTSVLSASDQANSPAYLTLKNRGRQSDTLLSASVEIARRVELYAVMDEGDDFKVQRVDRIEVPAGETIRLAPGGAHLLLRGLKKSLEEGQHFEMLLQFEQAGAIAVDLFVQPNAHESIY
jgi:copper(I)-binding protein